MRPATPGGVLSLRHNMAAPKTEPPYSRTLSSICREAKNPLCGPLLLSFLPSPRHSCPLFRHSCPLSVIPAEAGTQANPGLPATRHYLLYRINPPWEGRATRPFCDFGSLPSFPLFRHFSYPSFLPLFRHSCGGRNPGKPRPTCRSALTTR